MSKVVLYNVTLNELEVALSERDLNRDELNKLKNGILGGNKLKDELENFDKDDIDKTVQIHIKSHGIYLQTDRDELKNKNKVFTFLVRIPFWGGGDISAEQFLQISKLSDKYSKDEFGKPSMRLTTRQAIQFHRVKKSDLFPLVKTLAEMKLLTLNACGDNTRNPIASPIKSSIFDASALAVRLGQYFQLPVKEHLETFGIESSNHQQNVGYKYGKEGLPRKFKIGIAGYFIDEETGNGIRDNSPDIQTNDLGIAPIIKNNKKVGYQIYVGGGLGQKNGKVTLALLGVPLGIVNSDDELIKVIEEVVNIWSALGDRKNRHYARIKNMIVKKGLDREKLEIEDILNDKTKLSIVQKSGVAWLKEKLVKRNLKIRDALNLNLGKQLRHHGWIKQFDGNYTFGLWIENGRISDSRNNVKSMVEKIVNKLKPNIRLTTFQDLLLTDIKEEDKNILENIFTEYNYSLPSYLVRNSLACVGLPTCGLSVADSERYFMPLMNELEKLGLENIPKLTVGISGCERHCSRNIRHAVSIEGKSFGFYQLKLLFGKTEGEVLAEDIVYNGRKYFRSVASSDVPKVIKLLADNYLENKLPDEIEIGLFFKRIGHKGIVKLIEQDENLNHLTEKTYDPYIT
ncbi:MAG: hypothetical protein L3J41_01065 [Melioribacteraceae bacterium]|nr:hypothetical protein [Melioribacteraceae bacterium]